MLPLLPFLAVSLSQQAPIDTPAQHDARMAWWREARFGMFIHWGLYAIPAGKWGENTSHGEWIRETAQIPIEEYNKLQPQFNPVRFEAEAWARMAKNAGMKYVVLTSKHHDGFDLFDSKLTDWDVMNTPFKRDIVRELSRACRKQGLRFGLYHSIMDWHHPDYLPRRSWEANTRTAEGANFDRFVEYLRGEVTEILSNYGDIDVLWFDGEWESTWNDTYGRPLYELCRKLQPKIIVNNRVSNNRGGMVDEKRPRVGDFATPEQYIPATGLPGVDWESCMTMNGNWGYNAADRNWKSTETLVRNLVDIASKGGNYLLNIGPKSDGTFPDEAVVRLREMGAWMKVNGASIYGSSASPFRSLEWGRATRKGNHLYLHVFDWPKNGRLSLTGLATPVKRAQILGHGDALKVSTSDANVTIGVPVQAPNSIDTVIDLELAHAPVVYNAPTLSSIATDFVGRLSVAISGDEGLVYRYDLNGKVPTAQSPTATTLEISGDTSLRVAGFKNGVRVTGTTDARYRKVSPWPASVVNDPKEGLSLQEITGKFEKVPDAEAFEGAEKRTIGMVLPSNAEAVARRITGYVRVAADDLYRFALASDDGAKLYLDGRLVVDNDGLHPAETKSGTAPLATGLHRIEIRWFNATGGRALSLSIGRGAEEPKPLSPDAFVH